MSFSKLPHDLEKLIVLFAYGVCPKKHLLKDVRICAEHQRCIPPQFLEDRFRTRRTSPMSISPLNPFKRGNPYFPTEGLDRLWAPWSDLIPFAIGRLSFKGCREMQTYKGHMVRRLKNFMVSPIETWNFYCGSFFSRPGLDNVENYSPIPEGYVDFIEIFVQLLQESKFVESPWQPFGCPFGPYVPTSSLCS